MSAAEIAEAQRALHESLPPALLSKLRRRGLERGGGGSAAPTAAPAAEAPTVETPAPAAPVASAGAVDEEAKLQWTMPVGASDSSSAGGQTDGPSWRFGFDGLQADETAGDGGRATELYHHGEQPAAPGYTLAEICLLLRSTVANQRVLALQLLEAIVRRACAPLPTGETRSPTSREILDAVLHEDLRIPLLLRRAIDDSHTSVIRAGLRAMHAFLVDEDELVSRGVLACEYEGWRRLDSRPPSSDDSDTPAAEERSTVGEQEQRCYSDLVAGIVKMGVLPRLRYVVEVLELPQSSSLDVIRILRKFSQHSSTTAAEVAACPRLLNWLAAECVQCCHKQLDATAAAWLTECFHLLRELCDTSAQIAVLVWELPDLSGSSARVMLNATVNSTSVVCGAMRLWRSFLHGAAQLPDRLPVASEFLELYPALSACYIKPSSNADSTAEVASAMLDNFELLCRPEFIESGNVQWVHISGLFKDALWWLQELRAMMQTASLPSTSIALLGSLLHFVASYTREIHRPTASVGDTASGAESSPRALLDEHVLPCLRSPLLTGLIRDAPSILWTQSLPDTESVLDSSCPRLKWSPPKMAPHLNLVVGALRWLYQCTALQGPAWLPSAEYSGVTEQLYEILPKIRPGAGQSTTDSAAALRCNRLACLFRIFACRCLLEHSSKLEPAAQGLELIATAFSMLHSLGPGDEVLCIEFVHDSLLADSTLLILQMVAGQNGCAVAKRWQKNDLALLRRELLGSLAEEITGVRMDSKPADGKVDVVVDAAPSSQLPLGTPLFMLPFGTSGDVNAISASIAIPAARAGMQLFMLLSAARCAYGAVGDSAADALSLADAWCFVCRSLIAGDTVWQDDTITAVAGAICDQLVTIEKSGRGTLRLADVARFRFGLQDKCYGSSTSDLLEALLSTYAEDSFGEATLGRCVALFLRNDQPVELRRQVWRYCATNGGTLLKLLDPSTWSSPQTAAPCIPAGEDWQYELAVAQRDALSTPVAAAISASGSPPPPMFSLAVEMLAGFLRAGVDDDDGAAWERRQVLAGLCDDAEDVAFSGMPTPLHCVARECGGCWDPTWISIKLDLEKADGGSRLVPGDEIPGDEIHQTISAYKLNAVAAP